MASSCFDRRPTRRPSRPAPGSRFMIGGDADASCRCCMVLAVAFRLGSLRRGGAHGAADPARRRLAVRCRRLASPGCTERWFATSTCASSSPRAWRWQPSRSSCSACCARSRRAVIPRSSLLIFWFVAFTYVITSRFIARTLLRRGQARGAAARLRTAIYGAGEAGVQLAQTMQFSPEYKAGLLPRRPIRTYSTRPSPD